MNLFADLPTAPLPSEWVTELLHRPGVRIERIVSTGHASPEGFWYDQPEHEWVAVLTGRGEIEFADGSIVSLSPGDALEIPAHCRHRVRGTAPAEATVWLAVFFS